MTHRAAVPVVAVLNTKGGSGKTTLCVNVATAWHRRAGAARGGAVVILDTDAPQHTAADWRARAGRSGDEALPEVRTADAARELREEAEDLRAAGTAVFIDGAGTLEGMTGAAVHAADVVLIPVRPSPADLWGTRDLVDVVKARRERTDRAPAAAFVVSQAVTGANISGQVAGALRSFEMPTFAGRTGHRVAYAESMATGGTVFDAPSSKAAGEIEAITDELAQLLESHRNRNE